MKAKLSSLIATVALGIVFLIPTPSQAAFHIGGDLIWIPTSAPKVDQSGINVGHKESSFGLSAHWRTGVQFASIGLKLNYFNSGLEVTGQGGGTGDTRANQLDINGLFRLDIPVTGLSAFAEGGPSIDTNLTGFGYNGALGGQYNLFGLPFMDFNLGVMGQYVNVPSSINDRDRDLKSTRVMLFAGFELGV